MNQSQYSDLVKLTDATEAEKAVLIAFYLLKTQNVTELTLSMLCQSMVDFGLNSPNQSRLRKHSSFSRAFIKGSENNIKLKLKMVQELEAIFPQLSIRSEEIISDETILPESLFLKTRGYIIMVSRQINASYQHNLFDGCALLMRRLTEMLIIMTYKHLGREGELIAKHGGYHSLSYLINYSQTHQVLGLSPDSNEVLDIFRQLGNYSAHGVEYNCKKGDIEKIRIPFRVCVEELMYKCGLKH